MITNNGIVEIVKQVDSSDPTYPKEKPLLLVHPISTVFRLRHAELECYLATTGMSYPNGGFPRLRLFANTPGVRVTHLPGGTLRTIGMITYYQMTTTATKIQLLDRFYCYKFCHGGNEQCVNY